ncbi:MAG TPA: tRNA (adenosine(37)-N6)-dimethylallyltransferase MiaA [Candidatus Syntrophosphaera sp.]|nr:tRNA (adenosine(37)-N6)-dimethylallyltransferase MiaA [Candidatus Syntrophosphaera sp.]
MIPLVTIEGPTASGKSALALALARELGSQIVSADSRQVYRKLDIGTAKPKAAELEAVPHHLIGIIDPNDSYNAGRFCAAAQDIINRLQISGVLPIVCGGTGLYVASLLRGLFPQVPVSQEVRQHLAQRLAGEGLESLYRELSQVDPEFAARVSARDKQRILRGLEIWQTTGIPISEHWRRQRPQEDYRAFRILLLPPRPLLYERINQRVRTMLEAGWLDEIREILAAGWHPGCPGLSSLGYKELLPHILSGATLAECAALAAQHTRNYAKRQCTWYRKYKFDLTLDAPVSNISDVVGPLKAWLRL